MEARLHATWPSPEGSSRSSGPRVKPYLLPLKGPHSPGESTRSPANHRPQQRQFAYSTVRMPRILTAPAFGSSLMRSQQPHCTNTLA